MEKVRLGKWTRLAVHQFLCGSQSAMEDLMDYADRGDKDAEKVIRLIADEDYETLKKLSNSNVGTEF